MSCYDYLIFCERCTRSPRPSAIGGQAPHPPSTAQRSLRQGPWLSNARESPRQSRHWPIFLISRVGWSSAPEFKRHRRRSRRAVPVLSLSLFRAETGAFSFLLFSTLNIRNIINQPFETQLFRRNYQPAEPSDFPVFPLIAGVTGRTPTPSSSGCRGRSAFPRKPRPRRRRSPTASGGDGW